MDWSSSVSTHLFMVLVFLGNSCNVVNSQLIPDCSNLDIALVIDTSSSVQPVWSGPGSIQSFIEIFIRQFDIGFDKTRISSQTFADRGRVNWILRSYGDQDSLVNAVPSQEFIGSSSTFYDEAFRVVRNQQFTETDGDRPLSSNYVILLTDGTEFLENRLAVLQEAQALRDTGAEICVIGWGPNINREYMIQMAGDPVRVFLQPTVPRLIVNLPQIISALCAQTFAPPTLTPSLTGPHRPQTPDCSFADIALIIDTSSTVSSVWSTPGGTQDLIRLIINSLNIGRDTVRLSAQVFADRSYVNWDLDDEFTRAGLLNLVDPMMYFRGEEPTLFDQGLDAARTLQFVTATGDRPNAPNIAFLITDGTSSTEVSFATDRAAAALRNVATIYAISWGQANPVNLATITGDSRRVYYTPNYHQLTSLANFPNVFQVICPNTPAATTSTPSAATTVVTARPPPTSDTQANPASITPVSAEENISTNSSTPLPPSGAGNAKLAAIAVIIAPVAGCVALIIILKRKCRKHDAKGQSETYCYITDSYLNPQTTSSTHVHFNDIGNHGPQEHPVLQNGVPLHCLSAYRNNYEHPARTGPQDESKYTALHTGNS